MSHTPSHTDKVMRDKLNSFVPEPCVIRPGHELHQRLKLFNSYDPGKTGFE